MDEKLKYFEWQIENRDSEMVKMIEKLTEQLLLQDKGAEDPAEYEMFMEKGFRYQF